MRQRLNVTLTVTAVLWLLCSSPTLAQNQKPRQPDKFPPNPLEIITPDPLLPRQPSKKRLPSLTPEELQQLEPELDKLNQEAAAKLQAGDSIAAYEIWNRELRLRRYFGPLAEVQALGRVGAIAWSDNDSQQVQYITQRLQTLQKQAQSQKSLDLELLRALGQAYQQVRVPQRAVEVYEQVLGTVRQQGDAAAEVETLRTLTQVHLGWFDYPKAAATYEQLLKIAVAQGDRINEIANLEQLAYIYEQAKQPLQSVETRQKLLKIYQQENNLLRIPALKFAIASDYELLARENPKLLPEAFKNYQQAYTTAWSLQQYVQAGEALQKLIALYRSEGQLEEALQASQILLQAQQRAGNFYGVMNAYDQIGQIHAQRQEYVQARDAFEKGLKIAQQLDSDPAYFTEQIQKVSK